MGKLEDKYLVNKRKQLKIKRKELPKCPECGADAFLTHDVIGKSQIDNLIGFSDEMIMAMKAYCNNNGGEKMDMGYSCGCSAFRDGKAHREQMAVSFKTRFSAIRWWLRKVDSIQDGRSQI